MNFKNINIGQLIQIRVSETGIEISRICKFLKTSELEIEKMYMSKNLDTEILLRWCKLLEYDFFRIYSQHLILYSPCEGISKNQMVDNTEKKLPQFRKNIYTKEIISFILEMIEANEKTKTQIIEEYKIPKTTLHTWMKKYNT